MHIYNIHLKMYIMQTKFILKMSDQNYKKFKKCS